MKKRSPKPSGKKSSKASRQPQQLTPSATPLCVIEYWPLKRFVPYARNPRKNDHAVDRMEQSIKEFGFKIPVLARSNGDVVDGHLRLKAATRLKIETIPVILCDDWTEAQVKAFRLMVNRSVGWAEWDLDLLGPELLELQALDLDLSLTGFDVDEITRYMELETAPAVTFPEFDENAAAKVKFVNCPKCGENFPV